VPIFRAQLFRSTFHAQANDAEWRAAVTLWLKSWDQIPAGSLPDSDVELCRLAEFGRDQRTWKKVKPMALHGWYICDDLRLYHRVVSEGVMAAYMRRRAASDKGKIGASKRWAVIEGGLGNGASNGTGMQQPLPIGGTGTAQAMPGDSNLISDSRDSIPLPPFEKGVSRRHGKSEKDEAVSAWVALLASQGAKRDARVQAAIDAVPGGWSRIAQRQAGADSNIVRKAFCDAYRALSTPP
jgi:hypothetical protein